MFLGYHRGTSAFSYTPGRIHSESPLRLQFSLQEDHLLAVDSLCYLLNDFYQLVSLLVCGDTVTNAIAQWIKQQKSISSQFKVPRSKIKMSFRPFLSEISLLVFYIVIFIPFSDGHPSGLFVCLFLVCVCACVVPVFFPYKHIRYIE